jgi:DNA-binding NtrC family response regulator
VQRPKAGSAPESGRTAVPGEAPGTLRIGIPARLSAVERKVVLATLDALGGRKTEAATVLGISLKTLYSRLREYGAREEGGAEGSEDGS